MRRSAIERIDFRWDQGFISREEYIEKRRQLDLEIMALRPIDYDGLTEAADLIANFKQYWDACEHVDEPEAAQQQLISKIVDRVFVYANRVIALALYGDFGVIPGENETASYLVAEAISERLLVYGKLDNYP